MAFLVALLVFFLVLLLALPRPRAQAGHLSTQVRAFTSQHEARQVELSTRLEKALRRVGWRLSGRQLIALIAVASLLLAGITLSISGSVPVALVIGSLAALFPYLRFRQQERQRRETLALQFKEALTSIAYSLRSGASLQLAIEQALMDVGRIYPGGPIVAEFEELVQQLHLGVPADTVLSDWEHRLHMEEVSDFVAATLAVKSRGGNLAEVMITVSETIGWKIVAQAQIRALTHEKRSEANLLMAAPTVILVMMWFIAPQYISPLFTTDGGRILLLIGVLCNVMAFFATRKILESPL